MNMQMKHSFAQIVRRNSPIRTFWRFMKMNMQAKNHSVAINAVKHKQVIQEAKLLKPRKVNKNPLHTF